MLGGYIQTYLKNRSNLDMDRTQPRHLFGSHKAISY